MRENLSESIFLLENIWFRYARDKPDFLFQDLSLEIRSGESLALIGPSGEGKSTLLKLMTGLLVPEKGRALCFGRKLGEMAVAERAAAMRRIGMTFQNSGLFDSLSCGENLKFPLEESDSPGDIPALARAALAEVGLTGIEGLRTHQISGGMRKRLGIARAHILSPEVVLYDEPTAGLDPLTSRAIIDLILQLKRQHHVTVIVVTNDPAQAFQIAETIAFIDQGKIVQRGTPDEIRHSQVPGVRRFLNAFVGLGSEEGKA